MKTFQVFDSVIDHLDLFLDYRHTPGEVVVLPDFPGQLVHLRLHDGLRLSIGDQNTTKGDSAGDNRCNDCLHRYHLAPFGMSTWTLVPLMA